MHNLFQYSHICKPLAVWWIPCDSQRGHCKENSYFCSANTATTTSPSGADRNKYYSYNFSLCISTIQLKVHHLLHFFRQIVCRSEYFDFLHLTLTVLLHFGMWTCSHPLNVKTVHAEPREAMPPLPRRALGGKKRVITLIKKAFTKTHSSTLQTSNTWRNSVEAMQW